MKKMFRILFAAALFAPVLCLADGGGDGLELTRDEVTVFKKKLVAVLDAMGQPPAGFVKQKDNFSLPTEWYKNSKGGINAVYAGVSRKLAIKGVKDAEAGSKQLGTEYQKKILAAQAKGDYQEVMRISQEMQQKSGQTALAGVQAQEEKKLPIEVDVSLNQSGYEPIDPDLVVLEKPGLIALKTGQGDEGDPQVTVTVFFQPSALKDTKKLSKVEVKTGTVPAKTSVVSVIIKVEGPAGDVEEWVKRMDTKTVLAQIDAAGK